VVPDPGFHPLEILQTPPSFCSNNTRMRLLITGGCGFIGVNLVRRLLHTKTQLLILDNQSAGHPKYLEDAAPEVQTVEPDSLPKSSKNGVWFIRGDVRDRRLTELVTAGADAIVHLAAQTRVIDSIEQPLHDMEINVQGTVNLLEGARIHGVKRFIFPSSGAVLGEQTPPIDEEKAPRPLSPYGASKLTGEAYCSAYFRSFGVETVSLRFSNVYGPRSFHKGSVIAHFIKQVLLGRPLVIYGDGEQTRDFLYVEDLCDAVCACLSPEVNHIGGEVFQIATERETNVNEVARTIQDLAAQSKLHVEILHEPARKGEILRNYAKIGKAKRLLRYDPQTSLQDGIRFTWEWFGSNWQTP